MLFDHIAYFFPNMPNAFILHWIGRVSAPLFMFCLVTGVKSTHSIKKYLLRLYIASVIMSVIQTFTQIELNYFRTLFILAFVCGIIEYDSIIPHTTTRKRICIFILYQVIICTICLYLANISNSATETICFYLLPAITGSILTLEGGLVYVFLGIIFFIWYDDKKKMLFISTIYVIGITIIQASSIVPYSLYKIRVLLPVVGGLFSEVLELFASTILGLDPMNSGGNIFTAQYQWFMILAFLFIFFYNQKKGKSLKYLFYLIYPLHITVLWIMSNCI